MDEAKKIIKEEIARLEEYRKLAVEKHKHELAEYDAQIHEAKRILDLLDEGIE